MRGLAHDLADSLSICPEIQLNIHLGLHIDTIKRAEGINIGIQTEQLQDDAGRQLWGVKGLRSIRKNLTNLDVLLEISKANRPVYEDLDLSEKSKIVVGPWIFSRESSRQNPGDGHLVFFGNKNERRSRIIEEVRKLHSVKVLPRGTFGADLEKEIAQASAILNIHYCDGTYSEFPRILLALKYGKPLVSEVLADPLEAYNHYVPINGAGDTGAASRAFSGMSKFAVEHSFDALLQNVCREMKS